jgi:hypothetical protein
MTCPHCGESARFVEYRSKDIVSLVGPVRLSRGYYHCGPTAERLLSAWCHILKHAGGPRMITVVERLDRKKMSAETQAEHDRLLNYLRNNVGRMDYPMYLKKGWQIGSGAIESACKTVVNQRLCLGGMRWGEDGSDAVAHLRALYRSDPDQWDYFWSLAA